DIGTDNWRLVDEVYTTPADLPENLTVFPAVTDGGNINYPVVEDHEHVNTQKYRISYDDVFNVTVYDDYGDLIQASLDTIPVDTIYTGRFEFYTQENACNVPYEVNYFPDGEHYELIAQCQDTSFENDTI